MNILLSFTGFHDPFSAGLIEGEELQGPVLTLLATNNFQQAFLFSTPNVASRTEETVAAMITRYPNVKAEVVSLDIPDPTDYGRIFQGLRDSFKKISSRFPDSHYFIGISSGTPQMHACWIMLAASGEIPAKVLMTRPPRFVSDRSSSVQEVDLAGRDFPLIRSMPNFAARPDSNGEDIHGILRELQIVGDDPKILLSIQSIAQFAEVDVPVLILGETGTGKELFAQLLHRLSNRAGPFTAVNCSSIPATLAESYLFGHVKGAFTGATENQQGVFEKANGGTLFLDELGELPLDIQGKLLRALEDKIITPVGGAKSKKIDVRIVAATNRELSKEVAERRFREDLYYRLNVAEIVLPPLRERKGDIPKLALALLDRENECAKRQRKFSPEALKRLQSYSWPGNVRDLRNAIRRSILLSINDVMGPEDLLINENTRFKDPFSMLPDPHDGFVLEEFLAKVRKHFFLRALCVSNSNQSMAARLLGVSPQAVHKFLKSGKA